MDPVTLSIVAAVSSITAETVKRGYELLKKKIEDEYGEESDVVQAVLKVEREPDSIEAKEKLQETVSRSAVDKNPSITQMATMLLAQIEAQPGKKQQEIVNTLRQRGAILPCPRCGSLQFTLVDGYLSHNIQDDLGSVLIGGPAIPTVAIACTQCGFLSQHALGILGLLKGEEKENE